MFNFAALPPADQYGEINSKRTQVPPRKRAPNPQLPRPLAEIVTRQLTARPDFLFRLTPVSHVTILKGGLQSQENKHTNR